MKIELPYWSQHRENTDQTSFRSDSRQLSWVQTSDLGRFLPITADLKCMLPPAGCRKHYKTANHQISWRLRVVLCCVAPAVCSARCHHRWRRDARAMPGQNRRHAGGLGQPVSHHGPCACGVRVLARRGEARGKWREGGNRSSLLTRTSTCWCCPPANSKRRSISPGVAGNFAGFFNGNTGDTDTHRSLSHSWDMLRRFPWFHWFVAVGTPGLSFACWHFQAGQTVTLL